MLSIFPSLLIFGIFAPFILRVAVGIFFFNTGYRHIQKEQDALVSELSSRLGTFAKPFAITVAVVEIIIGLSLIAGFLTQIVAILGMIFVLKLLWFKNECPVFAKHEKIFYVMLFVILLSLLLTGAGAPAIDLPL